MPPLSVSRGSQRDTYFEDSVPARESHTPYWLQNIRVGSATFRPSVFYEGFRTHLVTTGVRLPDVPDISSCFSSPRSRLRPPASRPIRRGVSDCSKRFLACNATASMEKAGRPRPIWDSASIAASHRRRWRRPCGTTPLRCGLAMRDRNVHAGDLSEQGGDDLFAYFYSARFFDKPGDAARGKRLFSSKHCAECHGLTEPKIGRSQARFPMGIDRPSHGACRRDVESRRHHARRVRTPQATLGRINAAGTD